MKKRNKKMREAELEMYEGIREIRGLISRCVGGTDGEKPEATQ